MQCSTLILVRRRPLLDQWLAQLALFLGLDRKAIGIIAGSKRSPNGQLDVAMMQSLVRRDSVADLVAGFGQVIVDECHHLPAVQVERVLREVKAKYVVGLTATPQRRDGHHPITDMQLGPVRFKVNAKSQAAARPFDHRLLVRETAFRTVAQDRKKGRGAKVDRAARAHLDGIPDNEERLILATGRYIGEGFDDARLDTLFLTLPVSWKGTLVPGGAPGLVIVIVCICPASPTWPPPRPEKKGMSKGKNCAAAAAQFSTAPGANEAQVVLNCLRSHASRPGVGPFRPTEATCQAFTVL